MTAKLEELLSTVDRSFVTGDLRIENTSIEGRLTLSNLDVRGRIDVRDVTVRGDVVAGWLRLPIAEPSSTKGQMVLTEATGLDLEMLRCDGDVLLYGLRLSGDLVARNIKVRGHCDFVWQVGVDGTSLGRRATIPQERYINSCSAIIKGQVDLGGSDLGWLQCIATCHSHSGPIAIASGCLEQTTVKRLTVFEPLPRHVNMRSTECSAIELPSSSYAGYAEGTVRARFVNICQPQVEALALFERLLRKEGQFDLANNIMRST
jgi:hypothetical protein